MSEHGRAWCWLRASRPRRSTSGYGARPDLRARHIGWRSRGGPAALDDLVTLCRTCHGLVHGGLLLVDVAPGPEPPAQLDARLLVTHLH
jgi:hypothetical protein